jgi:hypothetical protein
LGQLEEDRHKRETRPPSARNPVLAPMHPSEIHPRLPPASTQAARGPPETRQLAACRSVSILSAPAVVSEASWHPRRRHHHRHRRRPSLLLLRRLWSASGPLTRRHRRNVSPTLPVTHSTFPCRHRPKALPSGPRRTSAQRPQGFPRRFGRALGRHWRRPGRMYPRHSSQVVAVPVPVPVARLSKQERGARSMRSGLLSGSASLRSGQTFHRRYHQSRADAFHPGTGRR